MKRTSLPKPFCAMRAHVVQHLVDVDRAALDRPAVGERLHAVDQRDDAVGLLADQAWSARARLSRHRLLEELGRAADAGQRVLHLVRQHGGHRARPSGRRCDATSGGRCCARSTARPATPRPGRRSRRSASSAQRAEAVADARRVKRHAVLGDARRRSPAPARAARRAALSSGTNSVSGWPTRARAAGAEELLGRRGWRSGSRPSPSTTTTGLGQRVEDRRRELIARRARRA